MKPKVHQCANNNPPVFSILKQNNPVYVPAHPISWRSILAISSHLSKWPLSLRFHHKTLYAHLLPPYLPKAPAPDITLLDFVTCTIHIMQLHTMQSAAANCYRMLSGSNIFLSTILLNTLSLCSLPQYETASFIQYQTIDKILVLYI